VCVCVWVCVYVFLYVFVYVYVCGYGWLMSRLLICAVHGRRTSSKKLEIAEEDHQLLLCTDAVLFFKVHASVVCVASSPPLFSSSSLALLLSSSLFLSLSLSARPRTVSASQRLTHKDFHPLLTHCLQEANKELVVPPTPLSKVTHSEGKEPALLVLTLDNAVSCGPPLAAGAGEVQV
jgi:hypothetical protein